jgi:hypothetical protein
MADQKSFNKDSVSEDAQEVRQSSVIAAINLEKNLDAKYGTCQLLFTTLEKLTPTPESTTPLPTSHTMSSWQMLSGSLKRRA